MGTVTPLLSSSFKPISADYIVSDKRSCCCQSTSQLEMCFVPALSEAREMICGAERRFRVKTMGYEISLCSLPFSPRTYLCAALIGVSFLPLPPFPALICIILITSYFYKSMTPCRWLPSVFRSCLHVKHIMHITWAQSTQLQISDVVRHSS